MQSKICIKLRLINTSQIGGVKEKIQFYYETKMSAAIKGKSLSNICERLAIGNITYVDNDHRYFILNPISYRKFNFLRVYLSTESIF